MLFYGKEINIFYIILLVIFILAVYISVSFYMQEKQSISLTTSSQSILSTSNSSPIPIPPDKLLNRGAFAVSFWINMNSWVPPLLTDASFNIISLQNNGSSSGPINIFKLYIDASCNLNYTSSISVQTTYNNLMSRPLPMKELVNVILNYNGDDDYIEDENYVDASGNPKPIYNTDAGFTNKSRALDVFINGRLNNIIILNTSLTSTKDSTCASNASKSMCVSYTDSSMNYFTNKNIQMNVGESTNVTPGPVGTISNVSFIKGGCSIEDAQSINRAGNSSNILDDLLSYKLRFSLVEDGKEVKVYDV
jgi:hypothetical protein